MTDARKVVVIGGGHNGLVCANYVARRGLEVTVLEAADLAGGMACSRVLGDGYRVPGCAHLLYQLDPGIAADLELETYGLRYAGKDLSTIALASDGDHLRIAGGRLSGSGVTQGDQTAYTDFMGQMARFAAALYPWYRRRPPRLNRDRREVYALARTAWQLRGLGRDDMRELLRVAGSNMHDVTAERFDHDLIRGALGWDAVAGTHLGTRSANSVLTFLHRLVPQTAGGPAGYCAVEGGPGALAEAMVRSAAAFGVAIRTGCTVQEITVEHGAVTGVLTADGERVEADVVVSSVDPKNTFLQLLGARHLEAGFAARVNHLRTRGNAAKLHLALDGLPDFNGLSEAELEGRLLIAPSSARVDKAFNPAKYGEYSPEPVMEITIPTFRDRSMAPAGAHVLSAIVQYAPSDLRGGWNEAKAAFTDVVLDRIAAFAPTIRQHVIHMELLTPADLQAIHGVTGGHWHHVELSLDNFLMLRPVPGYAQYRAPVAGLFLCGAGCHPGGGVTGLPGRNAAREILR